MITVKKILEQYDIVTDKASSHDLYLADLALSGIIEETKIPMIRRSLNKNINEMTVAEKKSLVSLIESLMANVIVEKSGGAMSYPSDKDMPTVIILKRKAIRVFPDNQKIGLYYSQALDRYISIPFGPNAKDLSPQLNEENLNEISQELATRAYSKRMEKIKNIEDSEDEPEKKAIQIQNQKRKLKQLSYRMMTTVADPTGKNIRPWAGRDAVKTGIEAGKMRIASNKATVPKDDNMVKRYLAAKPQERRQIDLSGKAPSTSEISKETGANAFDVLAAKAGAKVGDLITGRAKPPVPVKESFKENLRILREERQLDEVAPLVGSALGSALGIAGRFVGIKAAGRLAAAAGKKAASEGGGKISQTIAKVRGAARGVSKSPLGRIAGAVGAVGAGAAGVVGGALAGAADELKPEPSKSEYSFVNVKPQIGGPGDRANLSGQEIAKQKAIFGQNESTISTIKQIVENNVPSHQLQIGEETISINKSIAKKILKLHESLNRTNKKKLERMLNEDIVSFRKVINFALK